MCSQHVSQHEWGKCNWKIAKNCKGKKTQKIIKKESMQKLEKEIYAKEVGERQWKTRRIGETSKRINV